MGEAYLTAGDRKRALAAYARAAALDSTNADARAKVEELKKPATKAKKQ
jgi:cytochrome c-type biogenesis protein CcmH/NrfG